MFPQKDFTLQELAQISLGGTSFGNINISLLHTIINIALKKLDCENEKVIISGVPAEKLKILLQKSTGGPALTLDENDIKAPMKDYKKFIQLEEQVKNLERNVEQHMAETNFHINWGADIISHPCLTDYEIEEQNDPTVSSLLKNEYFARMLKEHLSEPIICRMNRSNSKLTKLSQDIQKFMKDCSDAYIMMDKVCELSLELKSINMAVNKESGYFDKTMRKIQSNMDLKEDNCNIIPFKRDFTERLHEITNMLKSAVERKTKLRATMFSVDPSYKLDTSGEEEDKELSAISNISVCDCNEMVYKKSCGIRDSTLRFSYDEMTRPSKVHLYEEVIINL